MAAGRHRQRSCGLHLQHGENSQEIRSPLLSGEYILHAMRATLAHSCGRSNTPHFLRCIYGPPHVADVFIRASFLFPWQGIALVDKKDGKDKIKISYVPASGLPFSPAERLAALFRIKSKWPMGELEPYIS